MKPRYPFSSCQAGTTGTDRPHGGTTVPASLASRYFYCAVVSAPAEAPDAGRGVGADAQAEELAALRADLEALQAQVQTLTERLSTRCPDGPPLGWQGLTPAAAQGYGGAHCSSSRTASLCDNPLSRR